MPNFVLKPGGAYYFLASKLTTRDGKPLHGKGKTGKGGGRHRVEAGTVVKAPSLAFFGAAQDRWQETTRAPEFVVSHEMTDIFDPEKKPDYFMPPSLPTKPFLFPTDTGLYHVFKSAEDRITDNPVELDVANEILAGLLQDEEGGTDIKADSISQPVIRRGRPAKAKAKEK